MVTVFLSHSMGFDRGDSFPFDFEPNRFHFVQNRKEHCHHDHIPFNVKGNGNIVFSVHGSDLAQQLEGVAPLIIMGDPIKDSSETTRTSQQCGIWDS